MYDSMKLINLSYIGNFYLEFKMEFYFKFIIINDF